MVPESRVGITAVWSVFSVLPVPNVAKKTLAIKLSYTVLEVNLAIVDCTEDESLRPVSALCES